MRRVAVPEALKRLVDHDRHDDAGDDAYTVRLRDGVGGQEEIMWDVNYDNSQPRSENTFTH